MQQGRHRGEGNALVKHALHFGIAARKGVADDDQVRMGIEIRFRVGFHHGDAETAQQIAHGRVSGFVGARNAMPLKLQQSGQRSHRRAADSAQMNVLRKGIQNATLLVVSCQFLVFSSLSP